ncbi:TraB/GumN family protein [Pseudophaeobacter arcticus]|uniref:TraB/GumN family protein n=1 Tax=Pseudophaeobacter arcticus TaxID=385492 RepID=UPI00248FDDCF|nr:TraB/GumN family protein [Pseudophaeobacter arcticus]
MRLIFSVLILLLPALIPAWAQAACTGTDLRTTTTPQDRSWIDARIADAPFAEGNHWIAQRGDRRIHVIGTMHLNDPRLDAITARLEPVLAAADTLLLEITPEDEAELQSRLGKTPELIFITQGPSLIDRLPAEDWATLSGMAQKHGIPGWMAAKMRPWFLAMSMSVPPCLRGSKASKLGLDKRLQQQANTANIPMLSLEDPMPLLQAFNEDSLDEQLRQMQLSLSLMGQGADEFVTLTHSYFEQTTWRYLAMVERRFYQNSAYEEDEARQLWDETMDLMLVRRNAAWIPVIEATEGNNLVVAVGTLHLPGKTGVLNLLKQQGYSLTRATF